MAGRLSKYDFRHGGSVYANCQTNRIIPTPKPISRPQNAPLLKLLIKILRISFESDKSIKKFPTGSLILLKRTA